MKQAREALLAQVEQAVAQLLGVGADLDREQRIPARSRLGGQHARGYLVHGVALHLRAAVGTIRPPRPRKQQAQKIVAFGSRCDSRARIARGVFLADGDGRRDAVDIVYIGLFHALEELARVSGEGFHVAPLALGVDGVEGEGRLTRPGNSCDDGELIMGDRDGNVLEVMNPRTADLKKFLHGKN